MNTCTHLRSAFLSALLLTSTSAISADTSDIQQQLDALKAENKLIMERLNASMDLIESTAGDTGDSSGYDHGSRGKTTVGGYGELHYANLDSTKEIDLHRFILFLGHEFSDKIRFFSELEVEHATVDGDGGEVSIEQAYIEFDIAQSTAIRAGVLLVPLGIINETHEPPTFYGVERNNVEKFIIPSTWREGGVSISGQFAQAFSYDIALHSGLQTSLGDNYAVRKGRQAVREAPAEDLALTARVKWTGMAGLEIGGGIQQQTDITQSTDATAGSATLLETHVIWQVQKFEVRALYASWNLNGAGPQSVGADEQSGWYIEPAYKLNEKWGIYARQSSWDNQINSNTDTESTQTDFGFSYWPHEDVVIKANYQILDTAGVNDDGLMLGIGYQF